MAHPNEESLRLGYDAFGKGDIETVLSLFTDDISWHIPGGNAVSGDYEGKEQVVGFFTKLMELTGGTFHLEVHDVLANDEHAIGLVKLTGERNGKSLNVNDAHIWHVQDGKFSEFWAHPFQFASFEDFFS